MRHAVLLLPALLLLPGCDRTPTPSPSPAKSSPEAVSPTLPNKPLPSTKFLRERPYGEEVQGVDACAYIGGLGFACLNEFLAESDPVKKRYMRRLTDADAREALESEKRGEPVSVPHAEIAANCRVSAVCGKKGDNGNPLDDGYDCLTKAELARAEKDASAMKKAHAFACKCGGVRASLPIMGGYLACDGEKPVERGHDLSDEEAKEIRDCATCDSESGFSACQNEISRLRQKDPQLADYVEKTHVPRCQK